METFKIKTMKKIKLSVAAFLLAAGALVFNSCIGSFTLTKNVMDWNNRVGVKFVNELVFVAFWILPVYEVTAIADLLVLNSIEFWSGTNPMTASTKIIDSEQGRYLVECDGKGYTIIHEATGREMRLDFETETQTWALNLDGELHPFMTFVDESHVKMIMPEGDFRIFDISEAGVMAYSECVNAPSYIFYALN